MHASRIATFFALIVTLAHVATRIHAAPELLLAVRNALWWQVATAAVFSFVATIFFVVLRKRTWSLAVAPTLMMGLEVSAWLVAHNYHHTLGPALKYPVFASGWVVPACLAWFFVRRAPELRFMPGVQLALFAGAVATVDIRNFWREIDESPTSQDYHYNRNAETYMLVGDALGRAMVGLLGGKAAPLPLAPRPKRVVQAKGAEPSEQDKAAAQKALAPIILDGIAASYVANPRYNKSLLSEASGERPQRANQFLRGAMYGLVNCYRAAGVHDFDWHLFGPDLKNIEWEYFSFDPLETMPKEKGNRYRKVTYPDGMQNWFAPDFDAKKAGWKSGLQPFGQLDGKLEPLSESCTQPHCGCGQAPKTLWEKEVLLVRGTFEIPPLKEGHRYRVVLGGSAHVNAGEGYAIYVNGRLMAESKAGVGKRQGGQPRGALIYNDLRNEFKGKVTIAATSFLRYNTPRGITPPRGHFSLWIEEAKIPPLE